ncbi:YceD family protein [Ornithinimicrobium sp. Y1847]|uniref:YceD family protein n=1 Tax=unclassified Ornithinimicrobium TaxID=2615080 RepID=UPI003B66CF80
MAAHEQERTWVVDTRELIRRPGTMKELSWTLTAPERIGTDVIGVPAGSEVEIDLRLESVVEGVLASGTVTASSSGVCVRCLDELEGDLDVTFQELFAYPERADRHGKASTARGTAKQTDSDEEEQYELDGDLMDLEEVLRDAIVTALPFQPVCRDDCPGLCSECGARLADDPDHHHDVIDPRWAALSQLASDPTHDDEKRK